MADVFISYSRRDAEYVQLLARDLEARGKRVWVDVEGIRDAEVFPTALRRAIEGSDAFVFVISPDSVRSGFCEQEVAHASDLNKRIVPLALREVADAEIPDPIRFRNWIRVGKDGESEGSVDRLVAALEADLEWEHQHTRLTIKSLDWDQAGRDRSFLLRGSELAAGEEWLAAGADKDPGPTALERAYLLAGRSAVARRQRILVVASLATAAVSIALLVFALISRRQAVSEQVGARAQALAAESQAQLSNDPEISVLLAIRAVHERATAQTMFALRSALDASPLVRTLPGVSGPGSCSLNNGLAVAYSPDGHQIAESACNGWVQLIDPASGRLLRRVRVAASAPAVTYAPGGRLLAVGTGAGVVLMNPATGVVRARLRGGPATNSVAFSRDGRSLAADSSTGITEWTLPRLVARTLVRGPHDVGSIVFSADGRRLIVGTDNYATDVYDVRGGRLVRSLATAPNESQLWPEPVAISPDGAELAVGHPTASSEDTVSVYSTRSWRRLFDVMSLRNVEIAAIEFGPEGRTLAVGGEDGTAGVWSLISREQIVPFDGQTAAVASLSFSPDGSTVVSASNDGTARLWRSSGPELASIYRPEDVNLQQLQLQNGRVTAVDAGKTTPATVETLQLPSGRLLARSSFGIGKFIQLDDAASQAAISRFGGSNQPTSLPIWNIARHRLIERLPPAWTNAEAFSPNGSRLVLDEGRSSTAPGQTLVRNLATGRSIVLARSHPCGFYSGFSWSADGSRIAGYGFCGVVIVWDARTGRLIRRINQGGEVSSASLNADGSRLLISSWDSRATIWNLHTGKPAVNLIGHTRGIQNATLSRDGSHGLTASLDHTVRLWNARTGQVMRVLTFAGDPAEVAFSPDGSQFAVADDTGTVSVWDTCPGCQDPHALLTLAAPHLHDQLTTLERTVVTNS